MVRVNKTVIEKIHFYMLVAYLTHMFLFAETRAGPIVRSLNSEPWTRN